MKRKRFTEEKIIGILKESEAGAKNQELCRKHGISEQTFYRWRSKYGGMQVSEAKKLRELEAENRKLCRVPPDSEQSISKRYSGQKSAKNERLAAVRSFVRSAALRTPESLDLTSRVLTVPRKRAPRRQIHYLTRPEMDAILAGCDCSIHRGRRVHILLLTLYNTGARVSEFVALRRSQVRFGAATVVQLFGEGARA